jgi:tRNA G18 (ribose-2'-O)-methylase SpoU
MATPPTPQVVADPADPRLDPYRDLRAAPDGTRRREKHLGHVVIEGRLALERALQGPLEVDSVLVASNRVDALRDMMRTLPARTQLLTAAPQLVEEVTGFDVHRGVLASAPRPRPEEPAGLLGRSRRVVVLEGLTDLENTGAVFRVAAALGLDGVLLDGRCADPLYRRCIRVSLGWSTVVPHARAEGGTDPAELARAAGLRTVALTPATGAVPVDAAAGDGMLAEPFALLVGAEGAGLDPGTIESADLRVGIPMARGVDSLNAATALAVVASFAASARGWS